MSTLKTHLLFAVPPAPGLKFISNLSGPIGASVENETIHAVCSVEVKPKDDITMWLVKNSIKQTLKLNNLQTNENGTVTMIWTSELTVAREDDGSALQCLGSWRGNNYTSLGRRLTVVCKFLLSVHQFRIR